MLLSTPLFFPQFGAYIMANYNLESFKSPAVENSSQDSILKFFDDFQMSTQSESKMNKDSGPALLNKCADTAKCFLPSSDNILRNTDDQSRRRDLTRGSDQLLSRGMEKSLLMGNLNDFDRTLKTLADNPQRAERVLQELKEQLAKRDIQMSFNYGTDVYGKTRASVELMKRNDWSKSSGFTSFTYTTDGKMTGEHSRTWDLFKPAQPIDPRVALNTVMLSERLK